MSRTRIRVKNKWRSHPKCSLVFCEVAFLHRIGMSGRRVTLTNVLKQIEIVEIVIETFWDLYAHCMGDDATFAAMVRGLSHPHAIADSRQVLFSPKKGDMMPYIPHGLKFVALRVSLRSVSTLQTIADALCMSRAKTLIYLLSTAYYAVGMPLSEASYADVYRAVYTSTARPVRNAKADFSRDPAIHCEP